MRKYYSLILLLLLSISALYGKSDNNDCFWYDVCKYCEFDNEGKIIESKTRVRYPQNANCSFEIQFDYSDDYDTAATSFKVYLNEIGEGNRRFSSKKLIEMNISDYSIYFNYINTSDEDVRIIMNGYELIVLANGSIILYEMEDGKRKNSRLFEDKRLSFIYEIRFKVLKGKIQRMRDIFKEKIHNKLKQRKNKLKELSEKLSPPEGSPAFNLK